MRLALASDLHADCWQRPGQALDWAAAPAADVLLLAGDLHDLQHGSAAELRKAAQVRRSCVRRKRIGPTKGATVT